jgi:hypothetical protein
VNHLYPLRTRTENLVGAHIDAHTAVGTFPRQELEGVYCSLVCFLQFDHRDCFQFYHPMPSAMLDNTKRTTPDMNITAITGMKRKISFLTPVREVYVLAPVKFNEM